MPSNARIIFYLNKCNVAMFQKFIWLFGYIRCRLSCKTRLLNYTVLFKEHDSQSLKNMNFDVHVYWSSVKVKVLTRSGLYQMNDEKKETFRPNLCASTLILDASFYLECWSLQLLTSLVRKCWHYATQSKQNLVLKKSDFV